MENFLHGSAAFLTTHEMERFVVDEDVQHFENWPAQIPGIIKIVKHFKLELTCSNEMKVTSKSFGITALITD